MGNYYFDKKERPNITIRAPNLNYEIIYVFSITNIRNIVFRYPLNCMLFSRITLFLHFFQFRF